MNCEELAQLVGISHQAMSKFISGQKDPSLWRLHTIADALGVYVSELFLKARNQ
jgi:DNA-binding XRE family transcriptional regulator